MSFFKVKKSDKFHPKTTRNTSRSQLIQGLDTNIHCLAVELSEWISPFVKPLKVIFTKCFVLIKQSRNVNITTSSLNIKKFPMFVSKCCAFLILHTLLFIVRRICLFDKFENLSMLNSKARASSVDSFQYIERYIRRVGEGLLLARISSFLWKATVR